MVKDYLIINDKKYASLTAITAEEQALGLMHQKNPPIMIFLSKMEEKKFWMKNCPVPLDILFCRNNSIIDIHKGEPNSIKEFGPKQKCNIVIEAPHGFVKKCGLNLGNKIQISLCLETMAKFITNQL